MNLKAISLLFLIGTSGRAEVEMYSYQDLPPADYARKAQSVWKGLRNCAEVSYQELYALSIDPENLKQIYLINTSLSPGGYLIDGIRVTKDFPKIRSDSEFKKKAASSVIYFYKEAYNTVASIALARSNEKNCPRAFGESFYYQSPSLVTAKENAAASLLESFKEQRDVYAAIYGNAELETLKRKIPFAKYVDSNSEQFIKHKSNGSPKSNDTISRRSQSSNPNTMGLSAQERWCANMQVLRNAARSNDPTSAAIAQRTSDEIYKELLAEVGGNEMARIMKACQ